MNYIENIYVCLAAPIFIAILCIHTRGRRMMIFVLGGMTVCLLSSYISTFIASVEHVDALTASLEISPFVEEIMKLCPVFFYLLVFEPGREGISGSVLMTAVGYATLENACYLSQNGAQNFFHLLIRGFGTGAMHVVCGAIIGIGLLYLWDKIWLQIAGTIGLLTIAVTYHGIYNMLVAKPGIPAVAGYFIPLATAFAVVIPLNRKAFLKHGPSK
ncbi:MAG: PrsW family intramembrane metalloprotease [Mogibacterium sp.]|nr:PrsW family intramembrane metalloprotease [Mogibacterium sp.]